jgi:hypothetical protein
VTDDELDQAHEEVRRAQARFDRTWRMYRVVAPIALALIALGTLAQLIAAIAGSA